MPLPPKLFYPICEIANRWSVSPIDIVGWAIDGRITLSAALPQVEAKQGRPVDGLVEISGQEVLVPAAVRIAARPRLTPPG